MIEFMKIRDVKNPKRNAGEDAGIDFFVPEYNLIFHDDLLRKNPDLEIDYEGFVVKPHDAVLIPTGIKSKFDSNLALIAFNKSGVCTRTQLIAGASVIDSSYHGEWHIHVINTSDEPVKIEYGTKLIQFIPLVINTEELIVREDTNEEEFYANHSSLRGEGGFGSTGLQ